mmetsp:Transcript_39247/g.100281  ORF Transcript_39247/g.100281 Transcript_39247/m.100281 type:complete len:339 (-) Transcript_39247:142-1158(-)
MASLHRTCSSRAAVPDSSLRISSFFVSSCICTRKISRFFPMKSFMLSFSVRRNSAAAAPLTTAMLPDRAVPVPLKLSIFPGGRVIMLSPPAFAPLRVRSVPSSTHSSALGYVTREVKVLFSATLQPCSRARSSALASFSCFRIAKTSSFCGTTKGLPPGAGRMLCANCSFTCTIAISVLAVPLSGCGASISPRPFSDRNEPARELPRDLLMGGKRDSPRDAPSGSSPPTIAASRPASLLRLLMAEGRAAPAARSRAAHRRSAGGAQRRAAVCCRTAALREGRLSAALGTPLSGRGGCCLLPGRRSPEGTAIGPLLPVRPPQQRNQRKGCLATSFRRCT